MQYKEPFVELHRILEALKQQDLEPALQWATENRDALLALGSSLEFKLHRLSFLNLVKKGAGSQSEAIVYARKNFIQFVKRHEKGTKTESKLEINFIFILLFYVFRSPDVNGMSAIRTRRNR